MKRHVCGDRNVFRGAPAQRLKEAPQLAASLKGEMTQVERRGCAYHEAGHAIVGKRLGRHISKVEIGIEGDPSKGHTHFDDEVLLTIVDGLAICCAGRASERMFGAPLTERALWLDRYRAEQILASVPCGRWLAFKRSGYRRAWRILKGNREAVIALAGELIEKGFSHCG